MRWFFPYQRVFVLSHSFSVANGEKIRFMSNEQIALFILPIFMWKKRFFIVKFVQIDCELSNETRQLKKMKRDVMRCK